ncbi:MAG: S53 family peptidase [Conexibacteraceae bacterium]|nr:S53 family peptidase [Conexibacteraceae bacterium]
MALSASPALAAGGKQKVSGGIDAAAIPGAKVFGNTPASTPETVAFIFKERNMGQLEAKVESGFSPYLSVSQFAAEYGQPDATVNALASYLAGYGIASSVYANNVDVTANGTAGEFDKALSVSQQQYQTPAAKHGGATLPAQTFHGVSSQPSLPSAIAQNLTAILGLTSYAPSVSNAKRASASVTAHAKAAAGSSDPSACVAASGLPNDCNLPSDFASEYGLNSLYARGATGQGQTLGIITLATADPGAPQYYWSNIAGVNRTGTLTYDNVDGGAGAVSYAGGSGETDLDIEQSGALAPGANVVVYQAPNTDPGFIDAFFTAATQDTAGSVSTSWGEAETLFQAQQAEGSEASGYATSFDEAMLELAAQGQASFVASGDNGAYDANGEFSGTDQPTNLSVDNPSDSPYTTAAGGTTLPWSADLGPSADGTTDVTVDVPNQRAWGWDYLWQPIAALNGIDELTAAEANIGGSGGGFSTIEPTPSYQQGVSGTSSYSAVPYLTPTDYTNEYGINLPIAWTLNPTPSTITGTAAGRAMPDVSTDADPYSGYILYAPSSAGQDGIASATQPGWGGTSFVAPELNGSTAVIDSLLGHRVGFWNPSIYRFAQSGGSPFKALGASGTGNDNLYYTGTPGALFNPGTGLGIPNFGRLAADFGSGR